MADQEPDIIIIRGAPGSGKSETAKLLANHFPKGVRLEVDTLRSMVISVDWTNQKEHIQLLNISAKVVIEFLRSGLSPIILVDTFSGDKLNGFLKTVSEVQSDLKIRVFGLVVDNAELKSRLAKRKEPLFKDFEACKKLNSDLAKFKIDQEVHIDTTRKAAIETTAYILDSLNFSI